MEHNCTWKNTIIYESVLEEKINLFTKFFFTFTFFIIVFGEELLSFAGTVPPNILLKRKNNEYMMDH